MTATTKFSAVDAARLALSAETIEPTPARERTVNAAAVMWCRELAFPTIRRLAAEVGRSPVTVLKPFGRVIDIYAEVIRREWAALETIADAAAHERPQQMAEHMAALHRFDPVLVRLPVLVEASIAGAVPDTDRPRGGRHLRSLLEWSVGSDEREAS